MASYMDVFMSHAMRIALGQLWVSSHTLNIEPDRAAGILKESKIRRLYQSGVVSELFMPVSNLL